MWIYDPLGFVSIVADRDSDRLLVRGRLPGDIERVFGNRDEPVIMTLDADYRYRTLRERDDAAEVISRRIRAIQYDNVKGAVPQNAIGEWRYKAMTRAWYAMHEAQEQCATGRNPKFQQL